MPNENSPLVLGTEKISKLLLHYAIPAIIAMTSASLYNIIDSIFIGHGVGPLGIAGLAIALPDGYAGFVQPRSGLAIKQGLSIVNTPGLIDAHYRGELKVILINLDPSNNIQINKGDRIAQLVIQEVPTVNLIEVEELDETDRGNGGFGSSGVA